MYTSYRSRVAVGVVLACTWATARADTVLLKSGASITGEIVGEDAHTVQVLISRTKAGDVRTVKIIDQESVAGMERNAPQVAVESDPDAARPATPVTTNAPAPVLPKADAASLREALKRADVQSGTGRYDDAEVGYRAVIEVAERQRDALRNAGAGSDRAALLDMLSVRSDAYALLLIALNGERDFKQESLRTADNASREFERRIKEQQDELDDLQRKLAQSDGMRVHRLGEKGDTPVETMRIRDLQARITTSQQRLREQSQWGREQQLAIVTLEGEIKVAREKARQAGDEYQAAKRESHAR